MRNYRVMLTVGAMLCSAAPSALLAQEATTSSDAEEIVVRASTRLSSGFDSPKPVITVDRDSIEKRGLVNIADYLNEIPSFRATTTPQSTGLLSTDNGVSGLDLRGLGPRRSLVLVDQRRHVATDLSGTININLVPQTLVKRVEVVTGGASAQWGSDAVAGVVNLITDRELEGVKLDARYGLSDEGDAKDKFVSFAYGVSGADGRGHITFAAEFQDNSGVADQRDRSWGRKRWGIVGNPNDTGPNDGIPARIITKNVVLGLGTDGGYLPLALGNHPSVAQIRFGGSGEILPYDIGEYPIPNAFSALPFQVGGDGGAFGDDATLSVPFQRKNLMIVADYQLSDNVKMFVDATYARFEARNETVQPWSFIGGGPDIIISGNPFIPDALQQTMTDNGVPVLIMARTNTDHGFITADSESDTFRIVAGLEGKISNWNWNAYVSHGETNFTNRQINNVIVANRNFAIDAVRDPDSGEIVCRANLDGANGAPGCVPLNLFGDGSPSAAALDYIHADTMFRRKISQTVVVGAISGEIAELPAGALSVALGAEYRNEEASTTVDKLCQDGSMLFCGTQPIAGDVGVKEVFFEAGVPILKSDSGMSLDVNGAIRYTDYSTSGGVTTWQAGMTFSPVRDVTLRGTVSRDIRAPNITELYSTSLRNFDNIFDPFTNQVRLVPINGGGNPSLRPEKAYTYSAGLVYQPSWVDGLSMSVDWYRIKVSDAISRVPAQTIVTNCFDAGIGCEAVTLVDGALTAVNASFLNVARQVAEGVDFEVSYRVDSVGPGSLNVRGLVNYTIEQSLSPDGVIVYDDAGVVGPDAPGGSPTPKWRWNMSADYVIGDFGLLTQLRYVGGGKYLRGLTPEDINDNSVSGAIYVNMSARYNFETARGTAFQLYAGVNNLLDKDPPVAPLDFVDNIATNPALYDVIGRYVYAGVRAKF
ncbi:TonB-dependent receptor domain-containing protein [Sphingosinicella sp.]|uniref:TonB-dependent receptor domain-containing protein n=1 Tax=Sphingosinicella sp. TaxID=1917971 RepID=UPI0035ADD5D2